MDSSDLRLELISFPAKEKRSSTPLLFIHGGFHSAWCWSDHFMPWFGAHGFDSFAISLRDHGSSRRTARDADWRLHDYVDDVRWAVRQIEGKPILIGHSLGGSIAQKVAAVEAFPGMILLAPSPIGGSNRAALRMMLTNPKAMWNALAKKDMALALPAFLNFFLSTEMPAKQRDHIVGHLNGLTSFSAAIDAFFKDPPKPRLTNMPVLVVAGEKDWSIPRYKNLSLANAYGGQLIDVPTAHDIMLDIHWEIAANQILDWLNPQFVR